LKKNEAMNKSSYFEQITIIFLFFLSLLFFVFWDYPSNIIKEVRTSDISFLMFLLLLVFSYFSDFFNSNYIKKTYHASLISSVAWYIWVGPYSAAFFSAFISVFLTGKGFREQMRPMGITKRFSVRFIMFSLPFHFISSLDLSFSKKLFLCILFIEIIRIILVDVFFPMIEKGSINTDKNNYIFFAYEIFFPLIIIPLYSIINDLKVHNYHGTDYFLVFFFFMMGFYLLLAKFYLSIKSEKTEKKKISRLKNGLESVLNTLKLVHSTENPDEIIKKSIKYLSEALEYRSACVYVLNRKNRQFRLSGNYGEKINYSINSMLSKITIDEFEELLQNQYYFGNTYFIPRESIILGELIHKFEAEEYKEIESEIKGKTNIRQWKEGDFFIIPMHEKGKDFFGFIVLDSPINKNRPSLEEAEIAAVFAEQLIRILESSQKYSQVVEKSQKDNMTGLYNHSHFYEILQNKLANIRPDSPVSLIMFDIDNFKRLNDTYGHITGDNVLITVAQTIIDNIPQNAFPARYGGEEFAILLENTGKLKTLEIANNLISCIRNKETDGISVTVSGGLASAPEDGCHASTLVAAADSALYVSKKTGKDRITLA